jgi:hypothetical protein
MEAEKSQAVETTKQQGFGLGIVFGLLLGGGAFWLTIKIVQIVSH